MLQLLYKNGAELDAQDVQSCTPLHLAVLCTQAGAGPDVVTQLLTLGANISIQGANGETAFVLAARLGRSAAIDSFLTHKRAVMSAEDVLCAFKWASKSQLDAAQMLATPANTTWHGWQQLKDLTDTSVALLLAAADKEVAAAHSALCSSIHTMLDVLPSHAMSLLSGTLGVLLGAIAADPVKQRAAVQNSIISMALAHKQQQQREMTAQSQELAQQRQKLEQMQHELAEQHRQVMQQLERLNAAKEVAGPSDAVPVRVKTAGGKRARLA
jgi:hypothetical protein